MIIEELAEAERFVQINVNGVLTTQSFNALYIVSNELGVLLPAYETDFLNKLTDIYDGHPYLRDSPRQAPQREHQPPDVQHARRRYAGLSGSIIPEVAGSRASSPALSWSTAARKSPAVFGTSKRPSWVYGISL